MKKKFIHMHFFSKKDVSINNLKIHTEAFGKPSDPACLLIAGSMSSGQFWTDAFCQYLANQNYYTIRYDHRDTGNSTHIDWQTAPYTLLDLANDAIAIMDSYHISQAHLVGHSMGGYVCQRIAIDHPNRILSLVLISTNPIGATEEMTLMTEKEEKKLEESFAPREGKTVEETIQNYLPYWRSMNGTFPLDEEMANHFTKDFLTRTKNWNHMSIIHEVLANAQKNRNILQKIQNPAIVIHGDQDPMIYPKDGKAIAHAISHAKLIMVPGMGHMFFNQTLEKKIVHLIVEHLHLAQKKR